MYYAILGINDFDGASVLLLVKESRREIYPYLRKIGKNPMEAWEAIKELSPCIVVSSRQDSISVREVQPEDLKYLRLEKHFSLAEGYGGQ